nr:one base was omitted in the sequence of ref.3 resulting in a shorter reading frame, but was corrected in Genbank accessno. X04268 to agree with ref. 4 [Cloning vector pNO3097]
MMDKRRTIAFKLNPDVNQTDKIVCDTLDSIPQGERSRLNRAALTAGLALYRQDPRTPFLLCELLTKETTFSDIVNILRSLFPKEMADFNSSIVTQSSSQQEQKSDEETKKNATKLIKLIQLLLSSLYPLSGWIKGTQSSYFLTSHYIIVIMK